MNKEQKAYAEALAVVQTLESEERRIETAYITEHGITNHDGSIPDRLWMIDSDETAEKAFEDTADELHSLHLFEARKALKAAEDDLIMFGISRTPKSWVQERETLMRICIGPGAIMSKRQEVIDMTFKLDVRTVRG